MNELWILALLLPVLACCLPNWRLGIFICVVVGFLQDPIRKLTPGEPIYLTALVGAPLAAAWLGAAGSGVRLTLRSIPAWPSLRTPATLFGLWVVLQAGVTLVKTGNAMLAGIGLVGYFTPLPAIILGYELARRPRNMVLFARIYVLMTLAMVSGIYLSYAGYDWTSLRSVGVGMVAYSTTGIMRLYSGFLRSPEVAAWHAATAFCIIVVTSHIRGPKGPWLIGGTLCLFLAIGTLLTGRRKFIVEPLLFLTAYGILLALFRKGWTRFTLALLFIAAGASLAYTSLFPDEWDASLSPYFARLSEAPEQAVGRTYSLSIDAFQWVVAQNGILGSGAGMGSQGAQHFGGGALVVGGAVEGGLTKIVAELGVPGLVLLLWVAARLALSIWSILIKIARTDPRYMKLGFGLVAFLFANALVFINGHQVFGDLFVLTILGFLLGFLFATPLMEAEADAARTRRSERWEEARLTAHGGLGGPEGMRVWPSAPRERPFSHDPQR